MNNYIPHKGFDDEDMKGINEIYKQMKEQGHEVWSFSKNQLSDGPSVFLDIVPDFDK